ncbi:MAG: FeoB-associated Cys-rich membrane protein [Ruminococcaceae bacterium]|nr:FeoB-associated Cys-rich membrane protein [Oscillospiraceae bacterium]
MEWISILIIAVIAAAFAAVVARLIINKKKGKHICSCGGSCGSCPMSDACGAKTKK